MLSILIAFHSSGYRNLEAYSRERVCRYWHTMVWRVIRPAHTLYDGDTIFALATGDKKADVNIVGACSN